MKGLQSCLKEILLPLTVLFGFLMTIVFLVDFLQRRYPVVLAIIGTGMFSGLILFFYIYFYRLIRWDLDEFNIKSSTSPNRVERLRDARFMLGLQYRNWLNSAGSAAVFEFVVTGAISAFVIGLIKNAYENTQSWRELLTIDYLYLFIISGACIVGCVIVIGGWLSMDRQFKKRLERYDRKIEEEIQRMQDNTD